MKKRTLVFALILTVCFFVASAQNEAGGFYLNGITAFDEGNFMVAADNFTLAIEADPTYTDAYLYRGLAYENIKNMAGAVGDYSMVLLLDKDNIQALKYRGKANYSLQNYNQAINDFSKLIENDPIDADAFFKRAESKFQLGAYAGAVKDYQSVINIDEDFPKVFLGIGFAVYRSGDLKIACDYWKISLNKGDVEATSKIEKYCNK